MKNEAMRQRTKDFALRIIKMYGQLPQQVEAQIIGKQVLRSGTSIAANYREACRARSDSELVAKMGIMEQELDETMLWLELLVDAAIVKQVRMGPLLTEPEELLRMTVVAIRTTKRRLRTRVRKPQ